MLQLFALVSPLFFQVVMDKVLVHRGITTLDVLVIGLVVVVVFESLLNALRTYVFSHTTSRIDVELGARLFRLFLGMGQQGVQFLDQRLHFQRQRLGHPRAGGGLHRLGGVHQPGRRRRQPAPARGAGGARACPAAASSSRADADPGDGHRLPLGHP